MTAPYIVGRADGSPVIIGHWPVIAHPDGTISAGCQRHSVATWRELWRGIAATHEVVAHPSTVACILRRQPARAPQHLAGAYLRFAILAGANLTGANLEYANLICAQLRDANLICAQLRSATLDSSTLVRANLTGANLEYANFVGANLAYANLTSANLTGANFRGAILAGATIDDGVGGTVVLGGAR